MCRLSRWIRSICSPNLSPFTRIYKSEGIKLVVTKPLQREYRPYGSTLWKKDPQQFAKVTKIDPLNKALHELRAQMWITGRRRSSGGEKADMPVVEFEYFSNDDGRGKITYTNGDVYEGGWMDDEKNGNGKETYTEYGGACVGEWLNNTMHGSLILETAWGGHFKLEYRDGEMLSRKRIPPFVGQLLSSKRIATFSNERPSQRICTDNAVGDVFAIAALPEGALGHVASYLATPSRAMLAAALTAPSLSWAIWASSNEHYRWRMPSEASRAIVESSPGQWECLDFEDIKRSHARRLSDEDLWAILAVIDAANNTKALKLAGCVNVVGVGLEPLRGSRVLQEIDLSLVSRLRKPRGIFPDPCISENAVIPILDSIISIDATALRHIQYPFKWRHPNQPSILKELVHGKPPRNSLNGPRIPLRQLIRNCNTLIRSLQLKCTYCSGVVGGNMWGEFNGLQSHSCYNCKSFFCGQCEGDQDSSLRLCKHCEKAYCMECVQTQLCIWCDSYCCLNCAQRETGRKDFLVCRCGGATCSECSFECDFCDCIFCKECFDDDDKCWRCSKRCCDVCWDQSYCEDFCPDCEAEVYS